VKKTTAIAAVAILAVAALASATEEIRWINVNVTEPSSNTNVEVHLPLKLVLSVIEGIKVDNFDAGKVDIELDDVDIDWPQILAALKDAPDGEFVKVDSDDAKVRIRKSEGTVYIHATEIDGDNAVVEVNLPESMLSALIIDDNNQIDVAAMLKGFSDLPSGELVRVTSDDANVRVWIE